MSLLMQALKKAGRNRPGALPEEDEATLASEPFDQVLALTPDDVLAGRVPPAPSQPVFSLEPMEAARAQEPAGSVDEQVPALEPAIPAPHDPTPPQARRQAAPGHHGLRHQPARATELRLDEAPPSAGGAAATPTAPAARPPLRELALEDMPPDIRPEPPFVAEASLANDIGPALGTEAVAPLPDFDQAVAVAAAAQPAPSAAPAREALDAYASAGAQAPAAAAPDAGAAGGNAARHGAATGSVPAGAGAAGRDGTAAGAGSADGVARRGPGATGARGAGARGTAARARAAAQAAAEQDQPRHDPARVRLAVLGGVLALVAGTLAGVYWYALTAPGPGASLPPVPMPPPGAGAGPAPVAVVAPPAADAGGQSALLPPATPDGAEPGAPVLPPAMAQETLPPATGYAGLPPARPPAAARQHGGSRMPSDDDLQRALQQQAAASPAAQPVEIPAGAAGAQLPPAAPSSAAALANTPASTAPHPSPGAATPSGAQAPAADIHVVRGAAPQRINAALQDGYQAFMTGDYTTAAQHYASALRQDPNNRDALLGNSAIAARRNDVAAATSGYQRLLELNPNDVDAQAGLLALRPGDPGQSEMRLKDLLRRDPGAGPLEFALGNLYAQQGRWTDAQQAYFRAYSSTPDNADYAFNLAVGLDRLSQRKLALAYYQRALDLSRTSPAAFDRGAARRRAEQLAVSSGPQQAPHPAPGGNAAPAAAAVPGPSPGAAFVPPTPPAPAAGAHGRQP